MQWIELDPYDPIWRRMLAYFILIIQVMIEVGLPVILGLVLVVFIGIVMISLIAAACGWDHPFKETQESNREEASKKEKLTGELAEKVEGKAGPGSLEKRDELERLKMEMESLQEMLKERTSKLVTLATREEKGK